MIRPTVRVVVLVLCCVWPGVASAFRASQTIGTSSGQDGEQRPVLTSLPTGIVGQVLDEDDRPIAGVRVGIRATNFSTWPGYQRSGQELFGLRETLDERLTRARREWQPTLAAELEHVDTQWRADSGDIRVATTDADGRFVFEDVPEAKSFDLQFAVAGYRIGYGKVGGVRRGDVLHAVAHKVYGIEFDFRHEDGTAIDEVMVRERRGGSGSGSPWRRAQPWIEFTAEPVTLQFLAGNVEFARFDQPLSDFIGPVITIDPADPKFQGEPLRVVLRPRIALVVWLDDAWIEQGGEGTRAVVAKRLGEDESLNPLDPDFQIGGVPFAVRPSGTLLSSPVVLDDPAPGRYAVALCDEQRGILAAQIVVVTNERVDVVLHAAQPRPEDHLAVAVKGASGGKLDHVRLVVDQRVDDRWVRVAVSQARAPNNDRWLALDGIRESAERLRVTAIHEQLGLVMHEVAIDTRRVEMSFPAPATLVIALDGLEDSTPAALSYGRLEYVGPNLDGRDRFIGYLAIDGHMRPSFGPANVARCEGLAPGIWHITVVHSPDVGVEVPIDGGNVVLSSGALETVRITVPKIYRVTVRSAASSAGIEVALRRPKEVRNCASTQLDTTGSGQLGRIAAGTYRMSRLDDRGRFVESEAVEIVIDGPEIQWSPR